MTMFLAQEPTHNAQLQFESGNYKGALAILTTAPAQSQDTAISHFLMARSHYELRQYTEAVHHGELAVKLDSGNSEYHRWLGREYGARAEELRSFFLARKVKQSFETAVRLAPSNTAARRDLMQYYVEAPWIVGGSKSKAREQIIAIAAIDPLQGKLAQAAYFATEKQWHKAEAEYNTIIAAKSAGIDPYMEAADFFEGRRDARGLERVVAAASAVNGQDQRLDYYRAVALILRHADLARAEQLLKAYASDVPERSSYPSRQAAAEWLNAIRSGSTPGGG